MAFTRHAEEKFALLSAYGLVISQDQVRETIMMPDKVEERGRQKFSMKVMDERLALRVIHEERKGIIVVITFYPVRRKRYGI